jgi:RNA polymerase sigma-70 factor (ECF subfamily)
MDKVQQEADRLYKKQYGKMIAYLLYYFRDLDIETAEDIVQDAFSAALTSWKNETIPANGSAWLFKVCKHKALNKLKEEKKIQSFSINEENNPVEIKFFDAAIDDQQLKLLFACAHPELSPKVQVVITLKYVINLKVEAIAKILGMSIDGIDKLLVRAKQKIRKEKILLDEPHLDTLQLRLPVVHKILYLIFNEGYKSSWGNQLIREELCEEALLMTKELLDNNISNDETKALYALMLFNSARFRSRFSASGELLDLEEQDRNTWNKDLILLGTSFLSQSRNDVVSSYHIEASIAYLHCIAESFAATDWLTITGLYQKLLHQNPNPFVELNYAIALYYTGEKEKAFTILHMLHRNSFMHQFYLLNITLGKMYLMEKDHSTAIDSLLTALRQTNMQVEKAYIQKLISKAVEETESL